MDLSLTESQQMLKATAAEFVKTEVPTHVVTELSRKNVGFVPELWRKAAGLGWAGMLTPAQYGGAGLGYTDTAVLFEELGRAPLVGPFFSSGVLAPLVILEAGTEQQKQTLLPPLARGERIAAVAISDPAPAFGADSVVMTATRDGDAYVLNGTKLFVHDAA
ncbi:MAG: acyl-CoA dehydrogenase family protein, partial [Chloroflexota bacterium]